MITAGLMRKVAFSPQAPAVLTTAGKVRGMGKKGLPFWPESMRDCINTVAFREASHVNLYRDDELWEAFPWKNKLK